MEGFMLKYSEAKWLVSRWGKGSFPSRGLNIRHHVRTRGENDLWKYLRKAYNFHKRGAETKLQSDGTWRFERKDGEFLIERDGKIVTYGYNRRKNIAR
jgi:glutathione peroxidase-family protein